ncbi:transposase [Oculatella sp. LEGE 06141]|uniref:RNA-guided endonuclease InsQ/TnpB family protein n=1 Tax=Oculatella sp. LEGE 06141 TaxID=1828648 RepID=UPI00188305A2|nr:RNA-guided endonuclease TnpB family protein [Oculatella sp. LEGE 06141]MBE9181875.1 transposase [Oculatella sp. LEGE 06141]
MRLAYQYRLLPTAQQSAEMDRWLDMLRHAYNWLLADRFDWYEQNRCPINACPLICSIAEPREQPDYYSQKRGLVLLKRERPWYADINAQVLQDMVKRVKLTFDRYLKGDSNGQRSGKPRFKGKGRYRSFTYPQVEANPIQGNRVNLSKIGALRLIQHRPLPDGFDIKTAIISKKADGWYVTLTLEDKAVPVFSSEVEPNWDNSVGIDVGLEKFASTSDGNFEPIPQHFRSSEEKLARLQQKVSVAKKGSRARKLLIRKVAKLHQKIARQRKQFHFEVAGRILNKADMVFVEDLNVKNMSRRAKPKQDEAGKFLPNGQAAKSGLNKSIADAGWSQFIDILTFKAEKAGQRVVRVDPKGTSQHCSACLNKVPKELSERWHSCSYCGNEMDRDTNAAILIKKVGLGIATLKNAQRTSVRREARAVS